jgi:mRNA export factor
VLSGGADNAARMFDVTTGQSQQVAQHDAPVKVVRWIDAPQGGILATGSWDNTIKVRYWHVSKSIWKLMPFGLS